MNSLRERNGLRKDAKRVLTEVVQKRLLLPRNTALVLVEGPDDVRVYSKFFDDARCKTIFCDGRPNLLDAAQELENIDVDGWFAVADSDFNVFTGEKLPPTVLTTDGHDLEIMILDTDALDDLLEELLKGNRRQDIDRCKREVRERLWAVGTIIGYLHLVLIESDQRGPDLDYMTFQYLKHLDRNCELALSKVHSELLAAAPWILESHVSSRQHERLSERKRTDLCRGHDMIEILSVAYSRLGSRIFNSEVIAPADLHVRLLDAFKFVHFRSTKLYEKILEWEYENRSFVILTM